VTLPPMDEPAVRERVCGNKFRHLDAAAARREARRLRGRGHDVTHYHCPFCGSWHVGHAPALETLEAVARILRGLDTAAPVPHEPPVRARRRHNRNRKDQHR
jgi:hypothetical protein